MAVDMFLKLSGMEGEAQDEHGHAGEIQVLAWSWGMSQSGTMHTGTGGGGGKVNIQDISVTKYVDKSTNALMKCCMTGKHFAEGMLTVRKAGGNPVEYLKVKMDGVLVTSLSTGGSGGEDILTENVSLNFAKVHVWYTPQKVDGTPEAEKKAGWHVPGNAEWAL